MVGTISPYVSTVVSTALIAVVAIATTTRSRVPSPGALVAAVNRTHGSWR